MGEAKGVIGKVHEGRNGRLFLGKQDGFDLARFASGEIFDAAKLEIWRRTISRRARELAARGVPYFVMIVPDAPSVYPEDLPADLGTRMIPPGQVLMDALQGIDGVTLVYPLKALRDAKGGLEIYKKKDSHWTTFGSYIGYRDLMRHIGRYARHKTLDSASVQFSFRRSYGDLGSMTSPEQSEDVPIPKIAGPGAAILRQMDGVARQTATESVFEGHGAPCRALFFRDSFMTDLAPYVARSFSHVMTIGSTTRMLLDAVDSWGADIVITEVAERKLEFIETDHQLEGYDTMFGAETHSAEAKCLLQARLMLADDPAGALRQIEEHVEVYKHDHRQAFSAAIVYEANGRSDEASDLANSALALSPSQGAYAALAGRTALARGELADAVSLTGRAKDLAAYNGYFHELHAYCLLQNSEPLQALRVIEEALATIDDHPNLHYWASVLHLGARDTQAASTRIQQAISLAPRNSAYDEQQAMVDAH